MKVIQLVFPLTLLASFWAMAAPADAAGANFRKATFAGGCFWCVEKPFDGLAGVLSATSGYTGGTSVNPTYATYAAGGHLEAVEVLFDPERISYQSLLDVYWRQIDPTDPDGQFVDRGHAYTTAIFYHDPEQQRLAEASRQRLAARHVYDKPIVTVIRPATTFYPAEGDHQDYYKQNPLRYHYYRERSGRDGYLDRIWGSGRKLLTERELRRQLTPLQYRVTQEEATEPAFANAYWDNRRSGIYVDLVSGEPLFSSLDKFDSGTGWPSFSKPLVAANVVEREDHGFFQTRTEVRSRLGDSHLGHVFADGPAPTGLRYCINSAALRFVAKERLASEGYGRFLKLFGR